MKIEQVRSMKTDELHNELERMRRTYFNYRAQAVTEKLESTATLGETRRSIARVLTVLRERGEKNIEQRQAHLSAQAARK